MASPKNLFRLLLLATLAFFAWTCNVSDSGKGDTILTLTVGDSLKASAGKYDSIQIQVIVVNGSDTSYKKLVFDGAYSNATQLQSLNLGKLPSNDFTIILSGYRQGAVVLVLALPFTGGKAGTPVLDSLIPPHASVLRMWLSPPDSGLNSLQIKEGITLAFQVMAKDSNAKDTAVLLHFINPLPSACGSPSYDSVSGNFSFKPAFACVDSGGATVMDTLKFMAKDKSNPPVFDTLRLSLIVLDSNSAPKWKEDTVSNLSDKQGRSISLALDSLYLGDAEGDAVSFTASLGNITQNPLGWSFTPSFSDSGVKTITLTATDSHHPPASSSLVLKLAIADSIRAFNVIITSPQNGYVTRDSVIAVHWSVNGINQTTDTTEHLMKQGANGVTRVYHDTLTNSSYSDSITVTRDTVPPNKPNVHVTSPTNNQRPTWNWESGGGGDGYFRQRLDTASFIDTVGAKDTSFTPGTNLAAGSHVLYVEERDDAGNWSAMASASVSIVLSGPLVVVTSPPNNYVTRQASVDVYWTLNGVAQTKVTKNLIEGTNTLFVGGADSAGNKDSTSVTVIRDTVPPNKPIVVGPGLTNSQKPTWTWHSGGGGGAGYYRYKLDTMSLTDTVGMSDSSFAPIINLAQGRHVLYIEERDVAGNWSAMDSSGIATVDTAAPSIQITSPPNNYVTRQATVDVYWTLNGVVEPKVTKNLVEGSNTLFVVGADSAGNKDSTSIIVVRDTVPPNKPVVTGPGITKNQLPTWTWHSGGNGGSGYYRYKLDNSSLTDTVGLNDSSYAPTANLLQGKHVLYIEERDVAGNWSLMDSSGIAQIDTIKPVVKIISPANGSATNDSINPIPVAWTVNGVSQSQNVTQDLTGLSGSVKIIRSATDSLGNYGADSVTITVDRSAPNAPNLTGPSTPTRSTMPTWSWSSSGGGGGYQYQLDGAAAVATGNTNFTPTTALATSATGINHTFQVREKNSLGTWSNWSATSTVEVKSAPLAPLVSINAALTNVPFWTWTPGGGGDGTYQFQMDNGTFTLTSGTIYTSTSLTEGNHTLCVQEEDALGWGPSGCNTIKYDKTAPALLITAPIGMASVFSGTPSAAGTASDANGIATSTYSLNNGSPQSFSISNGAWSFTPAWTEGENTLAVTVKDNAGNAANQSITIYKRSNVVFVRKGATGTGDGTSWLNAYSELSQALDTTKAYSAGTQIWVSAGTYQANDVNGFDPKPSISIYGGFTTDGSGSSLNTRDPSTKQTIVQGINGVGTLFYLNNNNVTLNGLIIQNAYYGLEISGTGIKVVNCVVQNFTQILNHPIDVLTTSTTLIDSSQITSNSSSEIAAITVGGALTLTHSQVLNNQAEYANGGGMAIFGTVTMSNTTFNGNTYTDVSTGGVLPVQITVASSSSLTYQSLTCVLGGSGIENDGGTVSKY